MQSIKLIRGSDGSGNASAATVQIIRSAGATILHVNTVTGIPTNFCATMGTPHTFVDPVTAETITVISEATAVDFEGHVDTGTLVIDTIAPGYTDAGSAVGDIVVIRPTTQYANNVADVLAVSHNDDGTPSATSMPKVFDHIESGCVLTGTGYGTNLGWSLSSGFVWINNQRYSVAAATGVVSANSDTYFDILAPATGTVATLVNTGGNIVANNAASPALAANSIRNGIIQSAATITALTSINQGQEYMTVPVIASTALSVTDSLGNLICPRDPQRKLLGQRQIINTFSPGVTAETLITGLNCPVIIPSGRKVKVTLYCYSVTGSTSVAGLQIYEGIYGSGGAKKSIANIGATNTYANNSVPYTPTSTSITYTATVLSTAGNPVVNAAASAPVYLKVELE